MIINVPNVCTWRFRENLLRLSRRDLFPFSKSLNQRRFPYRCGLILISSGLFFPLDGLSLVCVGLRGGELRLKLENGQMPSELRNEALKKILARELEIERQSGGEQESKSQVEASVTPDLSKASLKGVGEQRQKKSQVDKFQLKIAQVSHKGANNQPVWVFENRTGEPVLIGELADSLGKMLIAGVPWSVEATFTPEMRQVVITGLENLFKDDISGHKLNVFELGFAKLFLKHKTQP